MNFSGCRSAPRGTHRRCPPRSAAGRPPLTEFGYGDISLDSALPQAQLHNTREVLMNMGEDSLVKPFRLQQGGQHPFTDAVWMRLGASQPQQFTLYLRIPAWADGARLDLGLPRRLRLESIDRQHPDTVALLCGPLVLFALAAEAARARPQRRKLMAARQTAPPRWETTLAATPLTLLRCVAIEDEQNSTFLSVAG